MPSIRTIIVLAKMIQPQLWQRFKIAGTCIAALMGGGGLCGGEAIKAPVKVSRVAELPKGPDIEGALPRPLLLIKLEERGEFSGDRTDSSFWTFDPAKPEKGLNKIFSGPGQDQYLSIMTPLFGGYGLASGRLDPKKEPERDGPWFWFNPLIGKAGPAVAVDLWTRWMVDGWMVGEQQVDGKDGGSFSRIVRYHPLQAVVRTAELDFSYINWVGKSEVLGVARLKEGERVVQLNVETSEYEVISDPPPGYRPDGNRLFGFDVSPAGKNCRDGIYAVDAFSLWFRPNDGAWQPVIKNVHIVKTFGGVAPWLPVRYLGEGRFAVAKTVKDDVEVPETTPPNEAMFGAAEAVTMLIDGVTGEVFKQSKPFIYNHNPQLEIPEDWWAANLKPKRDEPEVVVESLFQWDEKSREVGFAGGKVLKLGEDDEREESGDGRYLVIYPKCPRGGGKSKTKIPFRILDGRSGQVHSAEVTSEFYEVLIEVSWHVLCAASPDPKTLKDYQDSGSGPE